MDEPSTSVARSKVHLSDEEQARLLGLPSLPPYTDNDTDTSSPTDLTEYMKLRISYRSLERLIKIFETINRGIKQ